MLRRSVTKELLKSGSGKVGLIFLSSLILISIYVIAAYPLDFGVRSWRNPSVWADNPKESPPAWTNLFSNVKKAEHQTLELSAPTKVLASQNGRINLYEFTANYQADEPPTFISFTLSQVAFYESSPILSIRFVRPDQNQLLLYSFVIPGQITSEDSPIKRYYGTPLRIVLSSERTVIPAVVDFARSSLGIDTSTSQLIQEGTTKILFGTPEGGTLKILKGDYAIQVAIELFNTKDSIGNLHLVLGGSTFGLLGTDSIGRDLAVGLLFGFPVALLIGLVTSILTTLIGALTGILSGYSGGRTDTLIQRVADVLNNIPLLPILIFLTFLFVEQRLLIVILVLTAFSWPGLTVIIRSMVLQIKSEQFIEAAKVLGASKVRIILRHIFPQTAPYVLAQIIFLAPSAILTEAALSFLGLGDSSLPTWGQILESGFRSGAVYVGFWWWILPPGLMIIFTAITFVLISLALEPVVNPRLRSVKSIAHT
jgi:peptide/nickel transport system permease protein